MKKRDGHRSATPFLFFATKRLSLFDGPEDKGGGGGGGSGGITDAQKKEISDAAVTAFKATLPKVPDKYEVKLPDKTMLGEKVLERTSAIAREMGLTSNEHAQRLVDFADEQLGSFAERTAAEHKEQVTKWEGEALKAADLGGGSAAKLQALVARATAFTNKHFPEGIRTLLNEHGLGSHPDFLRAITKLADLSKEDDVATGDSKGAAKGKSHADRIYPKQGQKA